MIQVRRSCLLVLFCVFSVLPYLSVVYRSNRDVDVDCFKLLVIVDQQLNHTLELNGNSSEGGDAGSMMSKEISSVSYSGGFRSDTNSSVVDRSFYPVDVVAVRETQSKIFDSSPSVAVPSSVVDMNVSFIGVQKDRVISGTISDRSSSLPFSSSSFLVSSNASSDQSLSLSFNLSVAPLLVKSPLSTTSVAAALSALSPASSIRSITSSASLVTSSSPFPPPSSFSASSTPSSSSSSVLPSFLPSHSSSILHSQQTLLNRYLQTTLERQRHCGANTVVYQVHSQSGLGNMIRGYFTAMAIGVLTDRCVQISSFHKYVTTLFFPPFPHLSCSFPIRSLHRYEWNYLPTAKNAPYYSRTPLSKLLKTPTILLTTYSDFTSRSLTPQFYKNTLLENGLISGNYSSEIKMGKEVRSVWLRLLLNPCQSLCVIINNHIQVLRERTIIGLQLRLGGQKANYVEKEMLPVEVLSRVVSLVWRYLKDHSLQLKDVYVLVSSDSDYAIRRIRKAFPSSTYVANDFPVGHSAEAKIRKAGAWELYTKRAILDLMLLKESDYLIYSRKSSFGKFAHELQMATSNPLDVNSFLLQQGLQCSVFHSRNSIGTSTYVCIVCSILS